MVRGIVRAREGRWNGSKTAANRKLAATIRSRRLELGRRFLDPTARLEPGIVQSFFAATLIRLQTLRTDGRKPRATVHRSRRLPHMLRSSQIEECRARAADIATAALCMRDAEDKAFLLKIAEDWRKLAQRQTLKGARASRRTSARAVDAPTHGTG
jgi:hypothetical protein